MKKIIAFLLVVSMTAAIAIGGTLAYLTDRDSEANVFTVGNVEIDLNEDFNQGAELIPGVNIEKKPTVTNVGPNDAWVWVEIAVPSALNDTTSASKNALHFNMSKESVADSLWNWWDGKDYSEGAYMIQKRNIDGVDYDVYVVQYETALKAGETTAEPVIYKVYLDSHVDIDPDGNWALVDGGNVTPITWNSNDDGAPVIYVSAYAMQTDGFPTVYDAYDAYTTQWTTAGGDNNGLEYGAVPVDVSSSEDLATAIADGAVIINLQPGTYQMPDAAKGKTLTINGTKDSVIEVVPAGAGEAGGQLDYSLDGSNVTFNGVTIKTNSQLYAGYARLSATYNDCVIQNTYNLGIGNSAFNNCTFNITNEYLRVGGASSAVFNGCTFNTDGRAILVFQDGTNVAQTVTVKDCTFNATAAANTWNGIHVAAVSIDGTNGTYVVNLEGTNTVDTDFNGLWQIKAGEANVTVNE